MTKAQIWRKKEMEDWRDCMRKGYMKTNSYKTEHVCQNKLNLACLAHEQAFTHIYTYICIYIMYINIYIYMYNCIYLVFFKFIYPLLYLTFFYLFILVICLGIFFFFLRHSRLSWLGSSSFMLFLLEFRQSVTNNSTLNTHVIILLYRLL